jgi:type 1 glutamine amidotransferase
VSVEPPARLDACLVAGGRFHDIDFARRELLGLLAEHDHIRTEVRSDWEDLATLTRAELIISYTCDVRPSLEAQEAMRTWVDHGGRWIALHGTNTALDHPRPNGTESPRCFPRWADTLGSQFIAHPPVAPYRVDVVAPTHPLVADIEPFETTDELYLMEHADRDALEVLLSTRWRGEATGYAESDWTTGPDEHLVQYLRRLGSGAVLYNTLGHCRGHYDMAPLTDYHPRVDRCSWDTPQYYELLRRAIGWAIDRRPVNLENP